MMLKLLTRSALVAAFSLGVVGAIAHLSHAENSIAQAIRCKPDGSTAEMKKCADDKYKVSDQKLNQTYQQVMAKLSGQQKQRLLEAQRAWIPFRDKTCLYESSEALGGSLEGLLYTNCLTKVTDGRTAELNKYLTQLSNGSRQTSSLLSEGTVKSIVAGDLMCYVTLVDSNKKEHHLGATFELCQNPNRFLNKKVRLSYKEMNVSDCQSAEPCGKTRKQMLITRMEVI